jgi:GntR family transcriptional regulator
MHIQINFRSGIPIYEQIVDQIRRMVVEKRLKPGDQLPTVRQLATDLRINFNTVARAYRALDEAGFISTQHGRGTYIWEAPPAEEIERLRNQTLEELVSNFLNGLQQHGYSAEEVNTVFERTVATWKTDGQSEIHPRAMKSE